MSDIGNVVLDTSNVISTCNSFGFIPKDGPMFKVSDGRDYVATREFHWQIAKTAVFAAIRRAKFLMYAPIEADELSQCFSGAGTTETGTELNWSSMNMDEIRRAVQGIPRDAAERIWKAPLAGVKHGIDRDLERQANAILMSADMPDVDWSSLIAARKQHGDEELIKEVESLPEAVFDIFPVSGIPGAWDYIPGRTKAQAFERVVEWETNSVLTPTEQTNAILERISNEENFGNLL